MVHDLGGGSWVTFCEWPDVSFLKPCKTLDALSVAGHGSESGVDIMGS